MMQVHSKLETSGPIGSAGKVRSPNLHLRLTRTAVRIRDYLLPEPGEHWGRAGGGGVVELRGGKEPDVDGKQTVCGR